MEDKWYLQMNYQETKNIIRDNLANMSRTFIAIGYYLRQIRDTEGYKEDGYESIWEFAEEQYGIKRSTTSRWMSMNEKFSENGNSPILAERYVNFGKSQLQEILYLDDEKLEEVTPEMTVKEIREIKQPESDKANEFKETEGLSEESNPKDTEHALKIPDPEEKEYLDMAARHLIAVYHDWMLEDFANRVLQVKKSPGELKEKLGMDRTFHFSVDKGAAHINLFDDYIQLWDGQSEYVGDYDWFYLAAAIQNMWNVVAMEESRVAGEEPVQDNHENDALLESKDTLIDELDLSVRTYNILKRAGVDTIGELQDMSDEQLIVIRDMSRKCLDEIHEELNRYLGIDEGDSDKRVDNFIEINEDSNALVEECATSHTDTLEMESESEPENNSVNADEQEERFEEISELSDLELAKEMLDKANGMLADFIKFYTDSDKRVRKQKITVAALAGYVCDADLIENPPSELECLELPLLKNNDQRKNFIDSYMNWPIWIETKETGERYYRYNLPDGYAMVVKVYYHRCFHYEMKCKREDRYVPRYGSEEYYLMKGGYFKDCLMNKSALVEHLKIMQKEDKNAEGRG